MTISSVTNLATNIANLLNLSAEGQQSDKLGQISSHEVLSTAVSGTDFQGFGSGTLLLKDRIFDEAYGYTLVQMENDKLSELYTHLENLRYVTEQIRITDLSDTNTYSALVEELDERELALSRFIGAQFHANDLSLSANFATNISKGNFVEIVNVYDDIETKESVLGQIAAIEVDFNEILASVHNEETCEHCIARRNSQAGLNGETPQEPHATSNTSNTTGFLASGASGNSSIDPLRMGEKWNVGTGDTLTYSFYDADEVPYDPNYNAGTGTPGTPDKPEDYGGGNEAALVTAFDAWDDAVSFTFSETEESGTNVGELRVSYTDRSSSAFAFAYGPGNATVNGDIYFETEDVDISGGDDFDTTGLGEGGYGYYAALHEIGHAIGLSHPFDGTSADGSTLTITKDNQRNTVMSYVQTDRNYVLNTALANSTSSISNASTYKIFASTPMLLDIEIVEDLYGADTATNSGNNTYVFNGTTSGTTINIADNAATYNAPITLRTIVDAGGTDTIDLSSQIRSSTLNMSGGTMSSIGVYSEADQVTDFATAYSISTGTVQYYIDWLDAQASAANSYYSAVTRSALYTGDENLGIAHNAEIENAIGGSGDDTITGNNLANDISGGAGADTLSGNSGDDTLTGGVGNDTIDGGTGTADIAVFSGVSSDYTISTSGSTTTVIDKTATDGIDKLTNVEYVKFSDGVFALPFTGTAEGSSPTQTGDSTSTAQSGGVANGTSSSLAGVDLSSQSGSVAALEVLDSVLKTLSSQLATLGAISNRLRVSINVNSNTSLATTAAIGRVADTDFSAEMAKLIKVQILSRASTQVLAGAQLNKKALIALL